MKILDNSFKILLFILEYIKDCFYVLKYNMYSPFEERRVRGHYRIIVLAHALEKGLSLSETRPFFGKAKIREITRLLDAEPSIHGNFSTNMAIGVLCEYLKFHKKAGHWNESLEDLKNWVSEIKRENQTHCTGGYRNPVLRHYTQIEETDLIRGFLASRFSCRSYENRVVDRSVVNEIVKLAQSAPSQCNRQSVRVQCIQIPETVSSLLKLQGGAGGFSHEVQNIFLVSSELTAWGGSGQRNQSYLDSGLFAQQLMLACHSYGIATCPLNLAINNTKEAEIKKIAGIHPRERLALMIAFGYPRNSGLKVANSPRLPLQSVVRFDLISS